MYSWIRPLLFKLDPERAHGMALKSLDMAHRLGLTGTQMVSNPVRVMNIPMPNGVGLGAGLDKDGAHIDALASLGFGFIEIGTVTPRAQDGNDKPRLYRLNEHHAIINRMGFNNLGVENLVKNVQKSHYQGVLGINIGKNATTSEANTLLDYLYCLERVYPHASYITVNISSPNTKNLRQLQQQNALKPLLGGIKDRQMALYAQHRHYVPLALKIAPDLKAHEIQNIAAALLDFEIDGLIATNTTISRTGVEDHPDALQMGGLSGRVLFDKSTQILQDFAKILGDKVDIIGAGGVDSAAAACAKIDAGAKAVQLYTGLVFQGTKLINQCARALHD